MAQTFSDDAERKLIAATGEPRTRASLTRDLSALGVGPGDTIIVHTSLRSMGWIAGGAVAYLQALMDAVGDDGTIVMPTQSAYNTDPAGWRHPPVPAEWHEEVRGSMPPFDPARMPTRRMGAVPELFRTWPDVRRSNHPSASFAAWGKRAETITERHEPQRIGLESPMAELYRLDGSVLLVGVGYERNTSFHHAEYLVPDPKYVDELMPLVVDGKVEWTMTKDVEFVSEEMLKQIGASFEATGKVATGAIGSATAKLFKIRDAVDFARDWLIAEGE